MKLRGKIQVSFCLTMVALLVIIGNVINVLNSNASRTIVNDSLKTSATLASNHISQQFEDYMNVVTLVGRDEVLSGNAASSEKLRYLSTYVDTYGFTSGNILNIKGVSIEDGTDFSDREYVKQALNGKTNISDITLSKYTGTYGVSVAAPIRNSGDEITGVVYFRLDINFIMDIIDTIKISENSYAFLVDSDGVVIAHPDKDLIQNLNLKEQGAQLEKLTEKITAGETGEGTYTYDGSRVLCGYGPINNTNGWSIVIAAPEADFTRTTNKVSNILVVMIFAAVIITIVVSAIIAGGISKPVEKIKVALLDIAEGKFDVEIPRVKGKDEVAVLQNTAASLVTTLSGIIGESNKILGSIARYDLTVEDMKDYPGEFNRITASVNSIKRTLNQLILEVQNSVRNVDVGSRELAEATAALSQGTVTQAGSIQSLADDLNVIVDRINRNSENEEIVNRKLMNLDHQIQAANQQMSDLLVAVDEIETMSSSIQKIVGTIDGIAFQTNILSLNASVEAARAGQMGNGFAVVAEEVRSLAEKCSESSKKTEELINKCIESINNAKKCADATFASLSGIVVDSSEISRAFEDISRDTLEQASKSRNIQTEINNISDVVQTNTATVEETAASTAVLSDQAMSLEGMVKSFKVRR